MEIVYLAKFAYDQSFTGPGGDITFDPPIYLKGGQWLVVYEDGSHEIHDERPVFSD